MGRVPCPPLYRTNSHTTCDLELLPGLASKLLDSAARISVVQETGIASWRRELPTLTTRHVALREPTSDDLGPLVDLLSVEDAARFGIEDTIDEVAVQLFIERAARDRETGRSVHLRRAQRVAQRRVGLVQVRRSIRRSRQRNGSARWRRRHGAPAFSSNPPAWSARSPSVDRRAPARGARAAAERPR